MRSRETRGELSRQINLFDFQLECFRIRKNTSFYRDFGRNRSIKTIDDYDGTVHRGPFQTCRGRPISTNGLDDPRDGRYKNTLICRRWIAIRRSRCSPPDCITTVIMPAFTARASIVIQWSARALDRRASIGLHLIQRLPFRHMSCILIKNRVEPSPTREKLKESLGFKRSDDSKG